MKKIIIPMVCFILWWIIASSLLYYQIQNRYVIWKNAWYLEWASDVFHFLDENIPEYKDWEYNEISKYFTFKYFQISVIDVDWVKTLKLIK